MIFQKKRITLIVQRSDSNQVRNRKARTAQEIVHSTEQKCGWNNNVRLRFLLFPEYWTHRPWRNTLLGLKEFQKFSQFDLG